MKNKPKQDELASPPETNNGQCVRQRLRAAWSVKQWHSLPKISKVKLVKVWILILFVIILSIGAIDISYIKKLAKYYS
jgi:hypothetical protein